MGEKADADSVSRIGLRMLIYYIDLLIAFGHVYRKGFDTMEESLSTLCCFCRFSL